MKLDEFDGQVFPFLFVSFMLEYKNITG